MARWALSVVASCLWFAPAFADDISDAINVARTQYQSGKLSEAAASLEFAAQLIREQRSAELEVFLPEPLEGWQIADATGGLGIANASSAEREYERGEISVRIRIVADSPVVEAALVMVSNPLIATADGGKLQQINGENALVKVDELGTGGTITVVVDRRLLVTVDGQGELVDLMQYATRIDFKALANFR